MHSAQRGDIKKISFAILFFSRSVYFVYNFREIFLHVYSHLYDVNGGEWGHEMSFFNKAEIKAETFSERFSFWQVENCFMETRSVVRHIPLGLNLRRDCDPPWSTF